LSAKLTRRKYQTALAEILGSLGVPAPKSMNGEELPEVAKDMFERCVLRDAGDDPLPSYNVRATHTEKERPLYGEAG
jgi:hypothetical protein